MGRNLKKLTGHSLWMLTWILIAAIPCGAASNQKIDGSGAKQIRTQISDSLANWTKALNAGDAKQGCDLFAPDLIVDIQGEQELGRTDACKRLANILKNPKQKLNHSINVKEIIVSEHLAVVRFVWKVSATGNGSTANMENLGMGIFRPQSDGKWKMARLMIYPAKPFDASRLIPHFPLGFP
jgi:uncharacterized protein (TIGR02246 family)